MDWNGKFLPFFFTLALRLSKSNRLHLFFSLPLCDRWPKLDPSLWRESPDWKHPSCGGGLFRHGDVCGAGPSTHSEHQKAGRNVNHASNVPSRPHWPGTAVHQLACRSVTLTSATGSTVTASEIQARSWLWSLQKSPTAESTGFVNADHYKNYVGYEDNTCQ